MIVNEAELNSLNFVMAVFVCLFFFLLLVKLMMLMTVRAFYAIKLPALDRFLKHMDVQFTDIMWI